MLSALRVVLKAKIYNNYIEHEISLVDYTQCAASARDLSNAITRHKPRASWDLSMTLSALKIFVKHPPGPFVSLIATFERFITTSGNYSILLNSLL